MKSKDIILVPIGFTDQSILALEQAAVIIQKNKL